jgi:hypothetical protein
VCESFFSLFTSFTGILTGIFFPFHLFCLSMKKLRLIGKNVVAQYPVSGYMVADRYGKSGEKQSWNFGIVKFDVYYG